MDRGKQKELPLVCYRCGTGKKKAKCKQYGSNVWCLKCKTEVDNMQTHPTEGDGHFPFGYGNRRCRCKKGKAHGGCPIHARHKILAPKTGS